MTNIKPMLIVLLAVCVPQFVCADEPIRVFTGIPPAKTFVERIGESAVEVESLLKSNQSPHSFSPTPRQIARLADSRLFFHTGTPFELRLAAKMRDIAPNTQVVDLCRNIKLLRGESHDHEFDNHSHSSHSEDTDPHAWMDPNRVVVMADTIADALADAAPDQAGEIRTRRETFVEELKKLDAELRQALEPIRGQTFYVFHPAFGYFADAYGLEQKSVEAGGRQPGPRQLAGLIDQARADRARVIFTQPQSPSPAARALAKALDGAVIEIDPLAPDYICNLRKIAKAVRNNFDLEPKSDRNSQ